MADPNIISVSSIFGRTVTGVLTTSSVTFLSCPVNKVLKINSIIICNTTGTSSRDVSISFFDSSRGAASFLASTIPVLPDSTLVLVSKESTLYLQENDTIRGFASANSSLDIIISYEEIG